MDNKKIEEHINNDYYLSYEMRPEGELAHNLHSHNSFELFVLETGSTSLLVADRLFSLSQGDVMLISPDVMHRNNGGSCHHRYALHFTMNYLCSYFNENVVHNLISVIQNNKITLRATALRRVLETLADMNTEYGKRLPYIHIAELLALVSNPQNIAPPHSETENKNVRNIMNYINSDFAAITGLDDIAKNAHITKEYMCLLFKRETGVTVSNYLNGVRIHHACELLKSGKYNVTETALMCGYNSSMYFCRMFKQLAGSTPKEYQKNIS